MTGAIAYPIRDIKYQNDAENPMQIDGFEFLEFASPEPEKLVQDFLHLGFVCVGRHKSKRVRHFQQGQIHFLLNEEPDSHAAQFARDHGGSVCAMGFRVKDAQKALKHATSLNATEFVQKVGPGELKIPAIYGIGASLIYLVDRYSDDDNIYKHDFIPEGDLTKASNVAGLEYIDHVTHNVYRGNLDAWAQYYERIFNFHEIKYFDIDGKHTGLLSRAMTGPCGKIRIPLNESKDEKSQIHEYLVAYNGEGIQHIALGAKDIYTSVEKMHQNKIQFLAVPDTYYEVVNTRVPGHNEDLERMKRNLILIDGNQEQNEGLLLQLFTENMIGPVFFEIIQRKGNDGFGHGNFQALFDAMELDQIRRGVLKV